MLSNHSLHVVFQFWHFALFSVISVLPVLFSVLYFCCLLHFYLPTLFSEDSDSKGKEMTCLGSL